METSLRFIRPFPALLLTVLAGIGGLRAQTTIDYENLDNNATSYDTSAPNDPTTLHSLDAGSATQSGDLTGSGAIIKTGAGSITLSGGNNTYTGGTTIQAGTLRLTESSVLGDMAGALTINGGALGNSTADVIAMIDNNVVVNADFAIDALDDTGGALGALEIFGNVDFGAAPRTITLTSTGLACFGGAISGQDFAFVTTATSSQVMFCSDTSNTFTGTLRVGERVSLELIKAGGDSPLAVSGNLTVDTGGEVVISNASQFASTSNVVANGTIRLSQTSGSNTFHALDGTGTVTASADFADVNTLEVHGGTFHGSLSESGGTLALKKTGTGVLKLTGASAYTGPTAIEGGTLDVSGSLEGSTTTVQTGATLRGSGSVAAATVADGGTITAGSDGAIGRLQTKNLTWEAGGTYEWKLDDATGAPGTGADWLDVDGNLILNLSAGNKFTIRVVSLTSSGLPGEAANFDPNSDRSWVLTTATSAITGFDADHFTIDTSGFANQPGTQRFVLSVESNDLVLTYVAVPEPRDAGLVAGAALLLLAFRRARERRA